MRKILLFVIIGTLLLSGCSTMVDTETLSYIEEPDRIQFHHNGTTINIERDTQHYHMILSLVNKGMADAMDSGIMRYTTRQFIKEAEKISGNALEFIYLEAITNELMIDGRLQKVSYERVLIPLDNNIILLGDDEGYGNKGLSISFVPKEFVATLLKDKTK